MLTIRPFEAQRREERVRDVEQSIEIDRHDVLPVFQDRIGIGGEGVATVDPGIVAEDRDLPHARGDLLCDGEAIVSLSDVESETVGLTLRLVDLGRGLCGRLRVDVEQHDARAFIGKTGSDGATDP
jgi:hypothetical protein